MKPPAFYLRHNFKDLRGELYIWRLVFIWVMNHDFFLKKSNISKISFGASRWCLLKKIHFPTELFTFSFIPKLHEYFVLKEFHKFSYSSPPVFDNMNRLTAAVLGGGDLILGKISRTLKGGGLCIFLGGGSWLFPLVFKAILVYSYEAGEAFR